MNQNENYGKKTYQFVNILFLQVKNVELLRIAGDNERGFVINSEGMPIIPGSSVAGAVQDYLKRRKENYYQTFWGNEKFDNKVYFFDSPLIINKNDWDRYVESRTRNKHDAKYGGAENKKLYENRYLKPGCQFNFVIKVFSEKEEQIAVQTFFNDLINGIQKGGILFGSQKNIGCGRMEIVKRKSAKFDFANKNDLFSYYLFDVYDSNAIYYKDFLYQEKEMINHSVRFTLHGTIRDALLIRAEKKGIDEEGHQVIESMKRNGTYFIPGSTWKGILRGYCEKIRKTLGEADFKNDVIEFMFGTKKEGNTGQDEGVKMGKIRVVDSMIEKEMTKEYTRIKIDRFTGGTITGAKMASNPVTKGNFRLEVELNPYQCENMENEEYIRKVKCAMALLFFALRDLGLGKISVGSFASVGFGRLNGNKMKIEIPAELTDNRQEIEGEIRFESVISFSDEIKEYLLVCINELREGFLHGGNE